MKTKLTQLIALLFLMASMAVNAQVPAKVGSWNFDDAGDMLKAETGVALELIGTQVSVPGPVAGNLATEIGLGGALKLTHGIAPNGGGTKVNEYTIMMDVQLPTLGLWHPFFQTDLTNTSDCELWSRGNNTFLGTGSLGYGDKALEEGVWYRMVISVQNGTSFQVYLNTEVFLDGNVRAVDDSRYSLAEALLLFTDDTPANDNIMVCSEVAVWDVALTVAQVLELGSVTIVPTTSITIAGEGDVSIIDADKGTLQMIATALPVDATYQAAFWSVADGTGTATISSTGLLSATSDGTVTVTGTSKDNPAITATKEITISNQILIVDPVGSWKFDDAGDMLKAELGLALELTGTQISVPGPETGNLATEVGTGSFLKLTHGIAPNGGGTKVNEYSIMMDVQLPTLGLWHPFIQTDLTNGSDCDLWSRGDNTYLGTGSLGYGNKALLEGVWYRMVISVKNGTSFQVYLNTELFLEGNVQSLDSDRYSLAEALLLFADNTEKDDNPVICSEAAIYDIALTEPQIMALGSVPVTLATGITVTGDGDVSIIDTDNGSLQMMAAIIPADATYQTVSWSVVNGTGNATISSTGLLTAIEDGTVTVTATAKDISNASGSLEVTISNQVLTKDDFNLIKDGGFATDGDIASPWAFWTGNASTASVVGGVCVMVPATAAENWQLQVNQVGNSVGWEVYNDESYVFMFDAKADAPRVFSIDFEDSNNGYARFGVSSDADAAGGESQWDVALTTDMTTYIRDVTFNRVKENTNFKLNIMPSAALDPVSIDNIYLINASDIHKFGTVVTGLTVKGEGDAIVIDTDMGTLQMMADILPVDATLQGVFWTVENVTGKATIDSKGLLSAIFDGTVTVTAKTKDGTDLMASLEVTISNQAASIKENANMIKDGHFDMDGTIVPTSTLAPYWGGWTGNAGMADVVDGVCVLTPAAAGESWQLQVNQLGNDNEWVLVNDVDYVVMFDAWADSARVISVDFEDSSETGYTRFGSSTDADASGGTSDWTFDLSTTKTTYTRVFTCINAIEASVYKFLISGSASDKVAYFDDIYLMKMADVATFPGAMAVSGITVTGEADATTITTEAGTLQMSAAILPVDATIMNIGWSVVDGTGMATIDANGLLTAVANGTVSVKATSQDWAGVEGMLEVTVSGQNVSISNITAESVKVYPNPALDELNVTFKTPNSKVAIYNSLGRKIEEIKANGTQVKFDVSKYAHGVYFVKVNNDSVVKFIK